MSKVKLGNVRLSFPSLFQTASFGGESTGKYEATFILDKIEHADLIVKIKTQIQTLMADSKLKISSDKICLKDGDELGRPEMEGKYSIKASTKKRPLVIDRAKSPITEDDNIIYAGCFVNGICSLWVQDNQYGRRINAQLDGVQFVKDGEPFGDAGTSASEFDAFGDSDEDENFGF